MEDCVRLTVVNDLGCKDAVKPQSTVHIHLEYHRVSPLSGVGPPPPPPPPPPTKGEGTHSLTGKGVGGGGS